jgi:hypothetical protein
MGQPPKAEWEGYWLDRNRRRFRASSLPDAHERPRLPISWITIILVRAVVPLPALADYTIFWVRRVLRPSPPQS